MNKTIVGISTALGVGAINIIRISGENAILIANKLFKGKDLRKVESHTINYGYILEHDQIIDEVLVTVMHAPRTYTMENIVEVNCHGGIATTNKILELLLENGCDLAEPGEFTKRAFLNGRIDLIEAEGVMDLIRAKTNHARKLAINQVDGHVTKLIKQLRDDILGIIANIEVNIDYPEYEDILEVTINNLRPNIENIKIKINKILEDSINGKIIKEGINTVIIGKPNVGKSSLLNKLIKEEKAIVTEIAGTTRDIVEGTLNLDGIILNIIDTAGIRKTENIVEKIGVEKSINLIEKADLILFVLDNNKEISEEELELINKINLKNHIIIINKNDLESKINLRTIKSNNIIQLNTIDDNSIKNLLLKIKELFNLEKIESSDLNYLTSSRAIAILKNINKIIDDINLAFKNEMPIDMIEIDIKKIWQLLGEIIGEIYDDELIDRLFKDFCLGK